MPLCLNPVSTERNQLVVWDPSVKAMVKEAQDKIRHLTDQGFSMVRSGWGEVEFQPPPRPPNSICFRIMCENGDDRIVWDRSSRDEVTDARDKFNSLIASGHTAHAVHLDGSRGHKLDSFDPTLEEILFVPKMRPS